MAIQIVPLSGHEAVLRSVLLPAILAEDISAAVIVLFDRCFRIAGQSASNPRDASLHHRLCLLAIPAITLRPPNKRLPPKAASGPVPESAELSAGIPTEPGMEFIPA